AYVLENKSTSTSTTGKENESRRDKATKLRGYARTVVYTYVSCPLETYGSKIIWAVS
ncbi:hypothetical protein NPIL_22941, partial [Nephila pilipes]